MQRMRRHEHLEPHRPQHPVGPLRFELRNVSKSLLHRLGHPVGHPLCAKEVSLCSNPHPHPRQGLWAATTTTILVRRWSEGLRCRMPTQESPRPRPENLSEVLKTATKNKQRCARCAMRGAHGAFVSLLSPAVPSIKMSSRLSLQILPPSLRRPPGRHPSPPSQCMGSVLRHMAPWGTSKGL